MGHAVVLKKKPETKTKAKAPVRRLPKAKSSGGLGGFLDGAVPGLAADSYLFPKTAATVKTKAATTAKTAKTDATHAAKAVASAAGSAVKSAGAAGTIVRDIEDYWWVALLALGALLILALLIGRR